MIGRGHSQFLIALRDSVSPFPSEFSATKERSGATLLESFCRRRPPGKGGAQWSPTIGFAAPERERLGGEKTPPLLFSAIGQTCQQS